MTDEGGDAAVFAASAFERRAVADLLEGLSERELDTPSLCRGWTVRLVGAHLAAAVSPSPWTFVGAVVRCGGNLHRANDLVARATAVQPVTELVTALRRHADSRVRPPVVGPRGPLTDVLVHAGDMRLPLGLPHDPDGEHVRLALEFVTGGRPLGFVPRRRLEGVQLVAEDLGDSWGSGAALAGRAIDVLMAACGRPAVLPRLHGPGLETLQARLPGEP